MDNSTWGPDGPPLDVSKSITHEDFIRGWYDGTLKFVVLGWDARLIEINALLRGKRQVFSTTLIFLYQIGPFILVPLFAIMEKEWLLLIAIPYSYAASFAASFRPSIFRHGVLKPVAWLIALALPATIAYSIFHSVSFGLSFGQPSTFASLFIVYGFFLWKFADSAQRALAFQTLAENPDLFNEFIATQRLMILKKPQPR